MDGLRCECYTVFSSFFFFLKHRIKCSSLSVHIKKKKKKSTRPFASPSPSLFAPSGRPATSGQHAIHARRQRAVEERHE